ncbi:ABC transporter substrate-binding protein [Billgrantia gudaonensis]|uniref:Putative hydroxymethylpyrimidine transport system substrate-binding protein n=1 Tax=Billgrantia gudaonensis TaxID=376427 RepID=A0A1G8WM92_9GAMM|nr:ABC transporter substrate-binding protein [Halomonas gudaonensis]SDJ79508.1 putative hydroxymethylpyrimidine transport system substrate-binding protein [Halomonas gudaonensis]
MIKARILRAFAPWLVTALTGLALSPALAESAGDEEAVPPLQNSEAMLPPPHVGMPDEPLAPGTPRIVAPVIVEVPPVVEGPSFLDESNAVEPTSEVLAPEVPSVAFEPAEPIAPPPVTALTVTLDWYLNPQHAALLVAREKGYFKRRGLDVTLVSPADPNVPAKLLAAGRTDLALGRQPLLHLLVDQGMPLVRVATLIDSPLSGIVLRQALFETETEEEGERPNSPQTLPQLHLGYTVQDSATLLNSPIAKDNGLPEGMELEDVNYEVMEAMREGNLDGVVVHQRHLLPRQLADEGIPTRILRLEEHGLPGHDGLILMANRDRLSSKRDAIRELVAALEKATLWIVNHREEAWELMTEAEPALNDPIMYEAWQDVFPRLAQRPAAVDQGRYARFEKMLLEAGLIDDESPVERLAIDLGAPAAR